MGQFYFRFFFVSGSVRGCVGERPRFVSADIEENDGGGPGKSYKAIRSGCQVARRRSAGTQVDEGESPADTPGGLASSIDPAGDEVLIISPERWGVDRAGSHSAFLEGGGDRLQARRKRRTSIDLDPAAPFLAGAAAAVRLLNTQVDHQPAVVAGRMKVDLCRL